MTGWQDAQRGEECLRHGAISFQNSAVSEGAVGNAQYELVGNVSRRQVFRQHEGKMPSASRCR